MLNPQQSQFAVGNLSWKANKTRVALYKSPIDEEKDHPMIREIRRRIAGLVHEHDELGLFDLE